MKRIFIVILFIISFSILYSQKPLNYTINSGYNELTSDNLNAKYIIGESVISLANENGSLTNIPLAHLIDSTSGYLLQMILS